ncbi:late embryogenesis abundant protein D-113-like [Hibiscus syriacus]|uniref:late embryogenesis abundant protein D-113-like n=1 Tax=Hibiscus syriacus TaxID=106335 RepID=UPI0019228C9B|nr:late embryogenesis abundant protein D-113-like [Hibiscus syriacus]
MQSMKGAAASAKAGMEKAKASMQEKVDQMKTSDPIEKERARERKEYRQEDAEMRKQEARHHNAGHGAGVGYGGGDIYDVNSTEKERARERKEYRQEDAEMRKQGARHHNAGHGAGVGTVGYGGGDIHDVNPTGRAGFTTGRDGLNHNRGGTHDASRGYPTEDIGTGYYSGRQVRADENMNMGYGGETGGGLGYSTTGGNIGGAGGGAGFTHNRGETGGYGGGGVYDASSGYSTADTGTGYDLGRQVRSDENMNMGYGGDTEGGLGYSTTGGSIGGTWDPNNQGTRRNTRGNQGDHYDRSY